MWRCGTCGRVLNTRTDDDGSTLIHQELDRDDHPVVPVRAPEGDPGDHCDFCHADRPTHVVPARAFEIPVFDGHVAGSPGDWSACERCAELVTVNMWTRLRVLARNTWQAEAGIAMPPEVEAVIARQFRLLRRNMTGAPRPAGTMDS